MKSFRLLHCTLRMGCAAGIALACATVAAQPYPSRPVRIVVPQARS
jgi:tripartite-type tricarboxylate transporter receptor subunit TctC